MKDFIFPQLETNSLPLGSNSTWIYSYLFISSGCNPWSTLVQKKPITSIIWDLLHRSYHRCNISWCNKCLTYYICCSTRCNSYNILPRCNFNRCKRFKMEKSRTKHITSVKVGTDVIAGVYYIGYGHNRCNREMFFFSKVSLFWELSNNL